MFIGFVAYGIFSFPYYLSKNIYNNIRYDREYRKAFQEGKKAFNTPKKGQRLVMPKEVVQYKIPPRYEKQEKSN